MLAGIDCGGAPFEWADRLSRAERHDSHSSSDEEPQAHFRLIVKGRTKGHGLSSFARSASVRGRSFFAGVLRESAGGDGCAEARFATVRIARTISHPQRILELRE